MSTNGLNHSEVAKFHKAIRANDGKASEDLLVNFAKRFHVSVEYLKGLTPKAFDKAKIRQAKSAEDLKKRASEASAEIAANLVDKLGEKQAEKLDPISPPKAPAA